VAPVNDDGKDGIAAAKRVDYLCHSCYVSKRSRFEVLPEGYEDIKTFRDIVARKKQLDGLAAASTYTSNQ
jgi:hypothetical protein